MGVYMTSIWQSDPQLPAFAQAVTALWMSVIG